jgi:hypothetical protein
MRNAFQRPFLFSSITHAPPFSIFRFVCFLLQEQAEELPRVLRQLSLFSFGYAL